MFVHNHEPNRNKLDPKSLKCIFLGYAANQKGYKCYFPEKEKLIVSMDVTFFETTPFFPINSLQGEIGSEGNFWNFSSLPNLPISESNPKNISLPRIEDLDVENEF